ncbi:MAG: hypothetical protein EA351_05575 [Gemmatimonadales bacterium]|nr:MAG: hypothetical protein EA351_05575 [Gemmatimonadales bacterium]
MLGHGAHLDQVGERGHCHRPLLSGGADCQLGEHGVTHPGREGVGPDAELSRVDPAGCLGHRGLRPEQTGEPVLRGQGDPIGGDALRHPLGDLALEEGDRDSTLQCLFDGCLHARLGTPFDLSRQ